MEAGEPVQHVPDHRLLRQDRRAEVEGAGLLPEPSNDNNNDNDDSNKVSSPRAWDDADAGLLQQAEGVEHIRGLASSLRSGHRLDNVRIYFYEQVRHLRW